jgi:hypothetical protein
MFILFLLYTQMQTLEISPDTKGAPAVKSGVPHPILDPNIS